jgi:hypothetical protein
MHGVSFDIGSKHAVAYFVLRDANCDLTVFLTDRFSEDDEVTPSVPARFMISIAPGKAAKVGSAEGTEAEFACARRADFMTVRTFTEVAYNKARP